MSSPNGFPPLPSGVRLALPSDIRRLGLLFVASFHYSPTMRWQRPHYENCPEDTLAWYTSEARKFVSDPNYITLVAVDKFNPEERAKTEATFPRGVTTALDGVAAGEEIPVALGVWKVGPELGRAWRESGPGKALAGLEIPEAPELLFRDRNQGHYDSIRAKIYAACDRWIENLVELDMMACHPAYWGRRHGSKLVRWGVEYSQATGIGQGVYGPEMGMKVYLKAGFEVREELEWEGDEDWPDGLQLKLAVLPVGKSGALKGDATRC